MAEKIFMFFVVGRVNCALHVFDEKCHFLSLTCIFLARRFG